MSESDLRKALAECERVMWILLSKAEHGERLNVREEQEFRKAQQNARIALGLDTAKKDKAK